jgi:hypothetical protein
MTLKGGSVLNQKGNFKEYFFSISFGALALMLTVDAQAGISSMSENNTDSTVTYQFSYTQGSTYYRLYVDTDNNPATGYKIGGIGADYVIFNGTVKKYTGTGTDWNFKQVGTGTFSSSGGTAKFSVARSLIGETNLCSESDSVLGQIANSSYNPISQSVAVHLAFTPSSGCSVSRSAFSVIRAENFDGSQGVVTDPALVGVSGAVGYLDTGDYLKYKQIDFSDGAATFTAHLAANASGGSFEIRLNSLTGPSLGTFVVTATGSWTTFQNQIFNLSSQPTGIHDLYLLMKSNGVMNLDSFVFSKLAAPVATPTPSSAASTITISQVVGDMSAKSEALPINPDFGWMYGANITQYSPAGSSIASWWTAERPTWCYGLQSWYTLFEAQGNSATNTRVEVKNLRVYILSQATRTWSKWEITVAPYTDSWTYPFAFVGSADRRSESDGGASFKPVYPKFLHGYGTANHNMPLPNPADVRAIYTAIDMRLVVADPSQPDDRDKAKYVVDSGADYYPDATLKMWSTGYAPGVGNGRYLLVTPNWRSATLAVPNKDYGATLNEFLTNPPPLN